MTRYNRRSDKTDQGGSWRASRRGAATEHDADLGELVPSLSTLFGPLYVDQVGRMQDALQHNELSASVQSTGATQASSTAGDTREETDEVRVLHVDDEPDITDISADYLRRHDDRLEVVSESRAEDALERLEAEEGSFDCIISDYRMPGMDGGTFLEEVREADDRIPFIMFTSSRFEEVEHDLAIEELTDYIEKNGADQYDMLAERIVSAIDEGVAR